MRVGCGVPKGWIIPSVGKNLPTIAVFRSPLFFISNFFVIQNNHFLRYKFVW